MTREIEFRGFGGTKWYYGDLEYNRKTGVARIHTYKEDGSYDKQYAVDPDTVGQFTGLCDKNGVKIFEGDIVLYNDTFDSDYVRYDEKQKVEFMDGCFYPISEEWCQDIKVIGNIHDNPELLVAK